MSEWLNTARVLPPGCPEDPLREVLSVVSPVAGEGKVQVSHEQGVKPGFSPGGLTPLHLRDPTLPTQSGNTQQHCLGDSGRHRLLDLLQTE